MPEDTAVAEETFVESVEDGQQQQQDDGQQQQQPTQTGVQDPEVKAALLELAKGVKGQQQQQQPTQQKELSDDEKAELWAVYNPEKSNPDFFKKWMRLAADMDPNEVQTTIAERKALFLEMQQGLMKQALTGARNISKIELSQLREEFAPVMEYYREAKAAATAKRFFDAYPALYEDDETGENKYAQVISALARTLADQTFSDEKAYFKALAEGAAKAIKGLVPAFDLGKKPEKKPAVTSPRLPRTRVGGTGGTAAAAAAVNSGREAGADDDSASLDFMK